MLYCHHNKRGGGRVSSYNKTRGKATANTHNFESFYVAATEGVPAANWETAYVQPATAGKAPRSNWLFESQHTSKLKHLDCNESANSLLWNKA